jgi:hypothetical protein
MRKIIGGSSLFFLFLMACGDDATGPSGPFALTVTTTLRSAEIDLTDDQPYICEYKCIAKSEGGEKGEYADWLGGRLEWIVDDSVMHTFNLSAAELLDRFGDGSIGRNQKQSFVRSASSADPYDLRVVLSARHSSGEVLADSALITCEFPADVMGPANLTGTWDATWVKWQSPDAIVWQAELISSDGALSFSLQENGSFSGSTIYPNQAGTMENMPVSGTLTVQESTSVTSASVTLNFAEGPFGTLVGTLTRAGNKLFLEVPEGAYFDFNRDGTPDIASLNARFTLN